MGRKLRPTEGRLVLMKDVQDDLAIGKLFLADLVAFLDSLVLVPVHLVRLFDLVDCVLIGAVVADLVRGRVDGDFVVATIANAQGLVILRVAVAKLIKGLLHDRDRLDCKLDMNFSGHVIPLPVLFTVYVLVNWRMIFFGILRYFACCSSHLGQLVAGRRVLEAFDYRLPISTDCDF